MGSRYNLWLDRDVKVPGLAVASQPVGGVLGEAELHDGAGPLKMGPSAAELLHGVGGGGLGPLGGAATQGGGARSGSELLAEALQRREGLAGGLWEGQVGAGGAEALEEEDGSWRDASCGGRGCCLDARLL